MYTLIHSSGDAGANGIYDNKGNMVMSAWWIIRHFGETKWYWLTGASDAQIANFVKYNNK